MLDLVDGPMHMKYLKVLQLDYTYGIVLRVSSLGATWDSIRL
jgi:hypothetical protein